MSRLTRSPSSSGPIPHTASDSDVSLVGHAQEHKPYVTQRTKRLREPCCEDIFLNFKEESKSMIKEMSESQNHILNDLTKDVAEIKIQNSKIQQSNQEIEKSLQFLSDQFDGMLVRVETLERERNEQLLYISSLEAKVEDMQRLLKSTTVEIRNVPCSTRNDNKLELTNIVQNTCKVLAVDFQPSDVKDVFRIRGKSGTSTLVVDFLRTKTKQELIKSAKLYNKTHPNERLNSTLIGLGGPSIPLYLSEGLTHKGRRLLYLARDFASTAKFKYCWTSNGKVFSPQNRRIAAH
ncbi:unnamed protein product [Parnassius apollo]|uniref:(apollo) hypothetical protein n=1 Tax=Parnassius apollo TaxID=110799 RepID=A0A8S3XQI6_PARAO|nr:unnamed protein product [Parnassius apollo]